MYGLADTAATPITAVPVPGGAVGGAATELVKFFSSSGGKR
jgi:hypothetical protein